MSAGPEGRLTEAEAAELAELEAAFNFAGGRGVELADRIDALRAKRDGTTGQTDREG